jgi:hypothetical protein
MKSVLLGLLVLAASPIFAAQNNEPNANGVLPQVCNSGVATDAILCQSLDKQFAVAIYSTGAQKANNYDGLGSFATCRLGYLKLNGSTVGAADFTYVGSESSDFGIGYKTPIGGIKTSALAVLKFLLTPSGANKVGGLMSADVYLNTTDSAVMYVVDQNNAYKMSPIDLVCGAQGVGFQNGKAAAVQL